MSREHLRFFIENAVNAGLTIDGNQKSSLDQCPANIENISPSANSLIWEIILANDNNS